MNDDLISRAAAIDAVIKRDANCGIDSAEVLRALPSAQPEQKKAYWVWDENAIDWGLGAWVCSSCRCRNDNIIAEKDTNPLMWVGSKYCPQCGAKMEEEK